MVSLSAAFINDSRRSIEQVQSWRKAFTHSAAAEEEKKFHVHFKRSNRYQQRMPPSPRQGLQDALFLDQKSQLGFILGFIIWYNL
jgi:hypothetical protein